MDSPREPFLVAWAVPDGEAFQDVAAAEIVVAVLSVDPSADAVDPKDVAAYAVAEVQEALLDHRGLAYDEAAEVHLVVAVHSCAGDHAVEVEDHGDSAVGVHVAEVDPAFAYGHQDPPVAGLEGHAGAVGLVPVPYAEDLEADRAVADTGYAARGTVRGFAKAVP